MKKPFKILLLVLLVLVLVVLGYVIYVFASYDRIEDNLTLKVNRPEQTAAQDVQTPQASQPQTAQIPIGETLSLHGTSASVLTPTTIVSSWTGENIRARSVSLPS